MILKTKNFNEKVLEILSVVYHPTCLCIQEENYTF